MGSLFRQNSTLIKVLVSIGLFSVIGLRMDLNILTSIAGQVHPYAWCMAFMLILLQILTLSYRWNLLINVNNRRMDYKTSLRITLVSLLANYLFITSIGGIIVRVALSVQHGVSLIKSIMATAIDRLMTLAALVILSVIFLPVLARLIEQELYNATSLLILMSLISVLSLALLFFSKVRPKTIFSNRKIAVAYKYLRTLLTDHNLTAQLVITSLIGQLLYFGAVYVVMDSLGADFPWLDFMAVMPIITIIASLPVGYGGWGIREGAFVYGLGLIHLPIEAAFAASVQIGLISLAAALIAGMPAFLSSETQFALKNWSNKKSKMR